MKKIINFIKNKKIYIFNIITILIILTSVLYISDLYPFSDITIAKNDSFQQYQPMLYNFIEKIRTGLLESYTFNNGFGGATAFNYVYYLSSPLNILCVFFKNPNSMFLSTIIIRTILTGVISLFYFRKKTNNNFISFICSIAYTFCGWFIAYYDFNIWLDIFMIFPLFHYGLEQLIEQEKCKIYIFTLAYMLISNFYLSFAVCLYTLVYFIYKKILKKEKYYFKIKSFQLIMFSTIISFLLCFLHLYLIYDTFTKIGILTYKDQNVFELDILSFISSIYYGQYNFLLTNKGISTPNIGMHLIIIINFFYYFINKNITLKEKLRTIFITTFFIIIIYSKTADFIIHGFHVPVGFTYRYSFIICFLLIYTFIKNIKTFNYKIDKKIYIIMLCLLILLIFLYSKYVFSLKIFISNLAFILSYTIFFVFYNKDNKKYKYIIIILIVLETICAFSNRVVTIDENDYTTENFQLYKNREYNKQGTKNPNTILYQNKNTIQQFSTMCYKNIINIVQFFDITTDGANWIILHNPSNIFQMFFNIKNDSYYLEKIFAVNKEYKKFTLNNDTLIFDKMIELATGYKNALIKQEATIITDEKIIYEINEDGYYRVNFINKCKWNFIDKNNPDAKDIIEQNSLDTAAQTLYLKKGYQIIITEFEKDSNPLNLYKENEEVLKNAHSKLEKNQINYSYYSDSLMEGTINVDKDQIIYTSIPYDKDWKVTIDGKKVKTYKITDSFIGFDCEEGTHEIKLQYKPNYTIPTIISVSTFISLILHEIIKRKKSINHND